MVDPDDDLGTAKQPFKVVACIPVFGRRPLLEQTILRLYHKNGVYKVICSGDQREDRKLCESLGAVWVPHRNKPLGAKWNAAFQAAKQYDPDACLFVGSSDWLSDNWLTEMQPIIKSHDLIGTPGCHFLHIGNDEMKLCYWPGYDDRRKGESIGIGRLISRELLERIQFKPFNPTFDSSLDYSMVQTVSQVAGKIQLIVNPKLKSVSISTDNWHNKHSFLDHWSGRLRSKKIWHPENWIQENFPEAFNVFK